MRLIRRPMWMLALLPALLMARVASTTTIDPLTWEQLVLKADFVGVVECDMAGGIVAGYKVIECWKGDIPPGTSVRIGDAVNYWEPQFPVALVGERYFMTAFKSGAPSNLMSFSVGGHVPLWWRQISYDYQLPLFQGSVLLKGEPITNSSFEHYEFGSWTALRLAIQQLLKRPAVDQEMALLKALGLKYLTGRSRWGEPSRTGQVLGEDAIRSWLGRGDAFQSLWEFAKTGPDQARAVVTLLKQTGDSTLAAALDDRACSVSDAQKAELRQTLESRHKEVDATLPPADDVPDLSAQKLAEYRRILTDPKHKDWDKAFTSLTRHEPISVVNFLLNWKPAINDPRERQLGYVMGSYFGVNCGKEREMSFETLLQAEDPFIRVAGGVYLCFEDIEKGKAALRKLCSLEGDPGTWAALNLARRGERGAVPRMLEVFSLSKERGTPDPRLLERVLVLLSNSAAFSGPPQPGSPPRWDGKMEIEQFRQGVRAQYEHWWEQNGEKLILHDPWLPELEKQKVD